MATCSPVLSPSPSPDPISPTSPLSLTLSTSTSTSRSIGHPQRKQLVGDYFAYDSQIGKRGSDVEEKCGHHAAGKFPEVEEKEVENEKHKLLKLAILYNKCPKYVRSLVSKPEFRDLLTHANPHYIVPGEKGTISGNQQGFT